MLVSCPGCGSRFSIGMDVGEEVLNPDVAVARKNIEHSSWAYIAEEIRSGHAYRAVSVGDEISFALKDGKNVSVTAVAENPYWQNSMAFCFTDCIGEYQMNDTFTNRGGWSKSKMRKHHIDDILPLLPDELVGVITERTIVQIQDGSRYESKDKIWLPSRTELFGQTEAYSDIDFGDVQFEYFKDEKRRVKMLDGSTAPWWERSPYYNGSGLFCFVNTNGYANYYNAQTAAGVAPAFII